MKRPPYPARVAAGIVATALEETRSLPTKAITLPMTAVSKALQTGMRLQQNIAEMAIKGDEVLGQFFDETEEQPQWATFDEDDSLPSLSAPAISADLETAGNLDAPVDSTPEPSASAGRFALFSEPPAELVAGAHADAPEADDRPEAVVRLSYDDLTLAQLRAKLRNIPNDDLAVLLEFEQGNRNRAPFVTMLTNKIASNQKK